MKPKDNQSKVPLVMPIVGLILAVFVLIATIIWYPAFWFVFQFWLAALTIAILGLILKWNKPASIALLVISILSVIIAVIPVILLIVYFFTCSGSC